MKIAFEATHAVFEDDEYALLCAFGGESGSPSHYLILQRSAESEPPQEDWGVHVEYNDQVTGLYNVVRRCALSRNSLSLELSAPLPTLSQVEGFEVSLSISDAAYAQISAGLRRIFRGTAAGLLDAQST